MSTSPAGTWRPTGSGGRWYCRAIGTSGESLWFAMVSSDEYPEATYVDLPENDAQRAAEGATPCYARYDSTGRIIALEVTDFATLKHPALWFVEVGEPTDTPPATNLVAFTGHGMTTSRLVDPSELAEMTITSDDQVGAIRWYPSTGEVTQVYVQPEHRRLGAADTMIAAGVTLNAAAGNPLFWGDGQRTAIGERWLTTSPWRDRIDEITYLAAPMTPFDRR